MEDESGKKMERKHKQERNRSAGRLEMKETGRCDDGGRRSQERWTRRTRSEE